MSASSEFKKLFTLQSLHYTYETSVRYRANAGIDRINRVVFEKKLNQELRVIKKKCLNGNYKFSQYKEKLIAKGAKKPPRVISIPTVRDKLTLKVLNGLLESVYKNTSQALHQIISEVYTLIQKNTFDSYLRIDVKDFYPSLDHELLFKILKRKIRKKEILMIFQNALTQDTVSKPVKNSKQFFNIGIPQGLPISNKLANIYMSDLDKKYKRKRTIKYFRFVDDILILCNNNKIQEIHDAIKKECKSIELTIHSIDDDNSKTQSGLITEGFTYLGYNFIPPKISVRDKSVEHIRDTIINIFTSYKYSDTKKLLHLKWNLDLRITGCILNETKYGWLFFFSQINDLTLLHELDHFVEKQINRFMDNPSSLKIKKFVRAYHEITKNLRRTSYIPNFDKLSIGEKRKLLVDIFGDKAHLGNHNILYQFNKNIYRKIRDLERDIGRTS